MIGYTLPEIGRLLIALIQACAPDPGRVWSWSRWRRRRQYQARLCHYRQRGYAFALTGAPGGWLTAADTLGVVPAVLIAMCGLGFSGKSVLARSLSRELGIKVLCYDTEIYPVHRHLVPPGSSVAAGYDFVQDIAREQIGAILTAGQSLIYDDLLLERDDRRKLAAVADDHRAELVLVYLDTPLAVINQRRAEHPRPGTPADIAEAKAQLDASLLEPPDRAERAIYVSPADAVADVAGKIRARITRG